MGKILLFGGTFDPPHIGHRHLVDSALQQESFDRVFLIPAYIPPHKDHHPSLSFEVRKWLLQDRFGDIKGLEVLDIEQQRGGKSYTIDTVTALQKQYPNDILYLLIGSDMFLSFERWYCAEQLLEQLVLVVGSRFKGDRARLDAHKKHLEKQYACKGILLCTMEAVECASSDLRAAGDGLAERALLHISTEFDLKRARHIMSVADYARTLAPRFGINSEKAYLAGLLHDCTKCYPTEWQIEYAKKNGIALSDADIVSPQILHQLTAPHFASHTLGAEDAEILSAIGCHTTGKAGMSDLDLLILFADSCEPLREYPNVENLRKAGEADLKKGALMLLEHTVHYLKSKKQFLHPQTVCARDDLIKELEKNG